MARSDDPDFGTRLLIGGIAGLVATIALTTTARRLLPKRDGAKTGTLALAAPFLAGAAAGALLAAANPRPGRATAMLAAGGWWLAGETGLLPQVALGPAGTARGRRAFSLLAGHLAWGWSAAEAMREIGD